MKPIKNTKQNKKGMAASTRDLLIAIGNEQYSKATVSFETYGIAYTLNGLLATVICEMVYFRRLFSLNRNNNIIIMYEMSYESLGESKNNGEIFSKIG